VTVLTVESGTETADLLNLTMTQLTVESGAKLTQVILSYFPSYSELLADLLPGLVPNFPSR